MPWHNMEVDVKYLLTCDRPIRQHQVESLAVWQPVFLSLRQALRDRQD